MVTKISEIKGIEINIRKNMLNLKGILMFSFAPMFLGKKAIPCVRYKNIRSAKLPRHLMNSY